MERSSPEPSATSAATRLSSGPTRMVTVALPAIPNQYLLNIAIAL
nr:MAG TPA: hypothetical protein [Caudoviricetes sp.]